MRKPFLAGNWKMNLDRESARALAIAVAERAGSRSDVEVGLFPPFVYLDDVKKAVAGSSVVVGAQNCCDQPSGAFTGEISTAMLVDVGADACIVGHSERRHVFGEASELVGLKVHAVLDAGLDVILCVGETLGERESQATEKVVREQLSVGLAGVSESAMSRVVIAYEPVWAIGTGHVATPEQAGEVHAYLRGLLSGLYTEAVARATRIQYGGSVKPNNVRELMAVPDVDGALVGGASLTADSFIPIIEYDR